MKTEADEFAPENVAPVSNVRLGVELPMPLSRSMCCCSVFAGGDETGVSCRLPRAVRPLP
jgi:hypothetical protein